MTGLCMSRNLGGPAMGLTLHKQLKTKYPKAKIIFAVAAEHYAEEQLWAKRYGVEIVPRIQYLKYVASTNWLLKPFIWLFGIISPSAGKKFRINAKSIHRKLLDAFHSADLVIDMSGIIYVGDGTRGIAEGLNSYTNFHYAKQENKPFVRFVQSFGPFDALNVRYFARREFDQSDVIFARGEECKKYCETILKDKTKIQAFPDIAILLEKESREWVNAYFDKNNFDAGNYVVLSPSAVIYNEVKKSAGGSIGRKHVEMFSLIAKKLMGEGSKIVLLPHMYSSMLSQSDREICRKVIAKLPDVPKKQLLLVEEDITPMQAKAIIAASSGAIVSRYHALVAAISTAKPLVTIGWNIKYYDLMKYYGLENYAIDVRDNTPEELCALACDKLASYNAEMIDHIRRKQSENELRVYMAFDRLYDWIDVHVNN